MMTSELSKMLEENEVTFAQSRGWLADAAAGARAGAKAEKKLELLLKEKAALQASLDSMVSAGRRSRRAGWYCPGQCFRATTVLCAALQRQSAVLHTSLAVTARSGLTVHAAFACAWHMQGCGVHFLHLWLNMRACVGCCCLLPATAPAEASARCLEERGFCLQGPS